MDIRQLRIQKFLKAALFGFYWVQSVIFKIRASSILLLSISCPLKSEGSNRC
jgi:hypothetical protein